MLKKFFKKFFKVEKFEERIIVSVLGIRIKFKNYVGNKIIVVDENNNKKVVKSIKGLNIKFNGNNGVVTLHKPFANFNNFNINCGSNTNVTIESSKNYIFDLTIDCAIGNSNVNIGRDFSIVSGNFFVDYNTELNIGDNCMFSYDVWIRTSDGHLVFNDGKYLGAINERHSLNIGDNCWVGLKTLILKNANLPNGTIVGSGAVVTKKFDTPNCAIGGNPAKVLKDNMTWSRDLNAEYIKN